MVEQMDAQNKWSGARKVMKEIEIGRVSSNYVANAWTVNASADTDDRNTGVTLWMQFCAFV
jgi:hypothetical protein